MRRDHDCGSVMEISLFEQISLSVICHLIPLSFSSLSRMPAEKLPMLEEKPTRLAPCGYVVKRACV